MCQPLQGPRCRHHNSPGLSIAVNIAMSWVGISSHIIMWVLGLVLWEQTIDAVNIFKYLHPDKVGVWLFDCSSAHEGLTVDALNVNNMNVNPGGKQKLLQDTIIPLNNPPPQPGKVDT